MAGPKRGRSLARDDTEPGDRSRNVVSPALGRALLKFRDFVITFATLPLLAVKAWGRCEMLTELQSEILGILFGDGSLSRNRGSVQIAVTGNKHDDREYLIGHVRPMFEQLFAIPLKVLLVKGENTMILYKYSKRVAETLHEWGMPFGRKKLSNLAPEVALHEVSFVRGLFDTDGCVYRKYGPYLQIQFKFASFSLLVYLTECLGKLGLHPTSITSDDTKFRFFLSRQAEIDHFFRIVEPKNPKHLKRFQNASRKQSYRPYKYRSEALERSGPPNLIGQFRKNTLGGAAQGAFQYKGFMGP